ncbi:hypothetical protein BC830DRAFT_1159810 [Chytriomyces sp. MP71]|nr:hypothetical protein BC830DRAFT_1159810 [Chytriomyces sp. MP71]
MRTTVVQAANPSVLYLPTFTDFHTVLEDFVDMKIRVERLAQERFAALLENNVILQNVASIVFM